MKRRTLLGAVAGGLSSSLALGTGALSSTRAERSITAEVVDDSRAYLQIDPEAVGIAGRSSEVDIGYEGKVAVFRIPGPEDDLVAGTDPAGVGVNSEYWFDDMAVIQNQGSRPVSVHSTYSGDLSQIAIFDTKDKSDLLTSEENSRELDVGESFVMGMYIETGDEEIKQYNERIGIIANSM